MPLGPSIVHRPDPIGDVYRPFAPYTGLGWHSLSRWRHNSGLHAYWRVDAMRPTGVCPDRWHGKIHSVPRDNFYTAQLDGLGAPA
jgi:hypothetical protein